MVLTKIGEREDKIILKNEDGNTALFGFLDLIPYKGKEYAVITDESDEAYIMEFREGAGGKETYREITDDALYDVLADLFENGED